MPGKLIGISPPHEGRVYWLDTLRPMTVGRVPGNDVVLEHEATVSARHALIHFTSPHFSVEDLNSENGTYVNEYRVVGTAWPLRHNDRLRLGQAEFRFAVEVGRQLEVPPRQMERAGSYPAAYHAAAPPAHYGDDPRGETESYPDYAEEDDILPEHYAPAPKSHVTAGLLAMLFGIFGAHHFYMDRPERGWPVLLSGAFTCSAGWLLTFPLGVLQGILYLVAGQDEFERKYIRGRRFL